MEEREGIWRSCEICREIPDALAIYWSEDKQFPPATKRLVDLGGSRGAGTEGFQQCPLCHTCYYWLNDQALTGSGSDDNTSLTRFSQTDVDLLQPLLDPSNRRVPLLAPLLSKGLSSGDEGIRKKTRIVFEYVLDKSLPAHDTLSLLAGLALDAEPSARSYAFERLREKANNKTDISPALPTLQAALADEDSAVRLDASEALAYHFVNREEFAGLDGLSSHHDVAVRRGLSWVLKTCSYRVRYVGFGGDTNRELATARKVIAALMPAIRASLGDQDKDVRCNASGALEDAAQTVDITSAFPQAVSALADDDSGIKFHAAGAFKIAAMNKADIAQAFPALIRLLSDESCRTQDQAAEALAHAARHGADISLAVDALADHVTDDHQTFSIACARALKEFAASDRGHPAIVLKALRRPTVDKKLQSVVSLIESCQARP